MPTWSVAERQHAHFWMSLWHDHAGSSIMLHASQGTVCAQCAQCMMIDEHEVCVEPTESARTKRNRNMAQAKSQNSFSHVAHVHQGL
jgi:hypothetical protein